MKISLKTHEKISRFGLTTCLSFMMFSAFLAQNSIVGDGFGGRLWYQPTNYTVGSYSGYSLCPEGENNQLYGWGSNQSGQIGYVTPTVFDLPVPIPQMTNVKFYTTGYVMAAIKNDSTGWVWGSGFTVNPSQVIDDVKFVDAAINFVSFIKNDGTVWSMGENGSGVFGNGSMTSAFGAPVQMSGITNAVRVACGYTINYILLEDGKVFRTGYGGGSIYSEVPEQITELQNIVDIKATTTGMMALNSDGEVIYVSQDGFSPPAIITSVNNVVAISGCCDGDFFLLLDNNKNCYYFNAPQNFLNQPVATDIIDIMAGETFSYIVKSDFSLWCKGGSSGGSIWLNLSNEYRSEYTQMDPSAVPDLCFVNGVTPVVKVETSLFIPNVFTPNGDGVNDVFVIEHKNYAEGKCTIVNRWGEVMVETDFPDFSWDGICNGKLASEGVYFYYLRCTDNNGEETLNHGFFHLK